MDEAHFKAAWEKDAANRAKQPWPEYQKWVRTFYEGKSFPPVPGWSKREKDILAALPVGERPRAEPLLQDLAKRLAAEWAKDNSVRKVSTSDLQSWGGDLEKAAKGGSALAAIERVAGELAKRGA